MTACSQTNMIISNVHKLAIITGDGGDDSSNWLGASYALTESYINIENDGYDPDTSGMSIFLTQNLQTSKMYFL